MSQGDQFHQYGYDHYLKAPKRKGSHRQSPANYDGGGVISSLLYSLGTSALLRKLHRPAVAGGVLAAALLLFIGVVVITYSSGDDTGGSVPIIKADLDDIKHAPGDPGGMDIPHRQSTILARGDQPSAEEQTRAVENLLASQGQEDLISKEEAFNRATQSPMMGSEDGAASFADSAEAQDDLEALHAHAEGAIDVLSERDVKESSGSIESSGSSPSVESVVAPAFDLEKPAADNILQKIGSSKNGSVDDDKPAHHSQAFIDKTAKAAVAEKPATLALGSASLTAAPTKTVDAAIAGKPVSSSLHGAGQSPETLEYVRSVLEGDSYDTGGVQVDGVEFRNIEPALGTSTDIEPELSLGAGAYFVQLASITDAARAPEEWSKMQTKYSILGASRFRVQEATLPGGTFYRIQAGPMSKDSANHICDSLKQAGKPGGCLVVK